MKNAFQKTIVVVAPYFPPHIGGLERYVHEVVRRLARDHGWRVVVITSGDRYGRDTKTTDDGITIYRLSYRLLISNTPLGFGWFSKVRAILKAENPSIVNVHTPVPGLGDIVAFLSNVPVVVTYHAGSMKKGSFFTDVLVRMYEAVPMRFMLWRAAEIVASSESVRAGFLKRYVEKSITIPPAVDHEVFSPVEISSTNRILFVASDLSYACRYKGLTTLIEAMEILHARKIDVRLSIVGDGNMRTEYEAIVARAKLTSLVKFHGRLSGTRLVRAYQEAAIFALPSANDSYPNVILEAMSSGLPVVSTTVGDIPLIIENGHTGFLITPYDVQALASRLEMLLHNPPMRKSFGEAARTKAVAQCSWKGTTARYDTLFKEKLPQASVVHVASYYPPHLGGVERVVKGIAERLTQDGKNVLVLTSSGSMRNSSLEHCGKLRIRRLRSFEFAHTPIAPSLFLHLVRLPRTSIVHVHLAQAYWPEMVLLACRLKRMPYIVHFHLDVAPSGFFGALFPLYKKIFWGALLRDARTVIVCSPEQIAILENNYHVPRERIRVIPNGVGDDFFCDIETRSTSGVFKLLSVGRLAPQKRLERLIEAMHLLTLPVHLTIVGDGEKRASLEALVQEYALKNVSFVGVKDDAQMQRHHRESDAFVISSEQEGLPLSLLEAMAAGLPVIGTNVIGIRELISGVGILVEPSPQSFVQAIEELARDKVRRGTLSKASVEKARQYAWPALMENLENVYRDFVV